MNMTINEALALQVAVKRRLSELQTLRSEVAVKKSTFWHLSSGENQKEDKEEPQFDVKAVDKKITELEIFLFKVDSKIKQVNAMTKIELEADVDKLLEPLQ